MRNQGIKYSVFRAPVVYFFMGLLPFAVQANENNNSINYQPAISIIIDDMGYQLKNGQRAVLLPGELTYSFLPHSPYAKTLAQQAHDNNKEVMLHMPMEAEGGKALGPGGLTECMTEDKFRQVVHDNFKSIPHVKGFNNHMGSLLTKSSVWMKNIMLEASKYKGMYFVDSKTTRDSLAYDTARLYGMSSTKRNIFIDHHTSKEMIIKQLEKVIKRAKRKGTALAIAHPKKNTLQVLRQWLPELDKQGIKLVPVSQLIQLENKWRLALWQRTTP